MTLVKPPPSPTRAGLLPDATHVVLPAGIASTAFPATEATCRQIGILFDRWQADLNRCILAKAADGLYAADTVMLSICRQAGKTYDIGGVVFADSIINAGTTTVWTAHRFKVARESFNEMRAWAKSPRLRQHIDYDEITTAAGNECIPFRNGSRILFAARERGSIRGFTKVRRLVLDEGQILTELALSDLVPTVNQAENPQIILMGTPPKPTDPSEVWARLRVEALAGTSEGLLYVEFSAPAGSEPLDEDVWRKANPSYPQRTPAKAILRMYKLLSADDFQREALGIWPPETPEDQLLAAWLACVDVTSQPSGRPVFCLDVSPGSRSAAVLAGLRRADGLPHLEVAAHECGTGWVAGWAIEREAKHQPLGWVADPTGPAGGLLGKRDTPDGVRYVIKGTDSLPDGSARQPIFITELVGRDMGQACEAFTVAVTDGKLRHLGDMRLQTALGGAGRRDIGDGLWAWSRRKSGTDICPLVAATGVLWGLGKFASSTFFGAWR